MENKKELSKLGNKIKTLRKQNNLTQSAFGVSQSVFAGYENGQVSMNVLAFKNICQKLKVSADYLLDLPNEFDELSDEKKVNYLMMKKLTRDNDLKLTGMILAMLENQEK